MGKTFIIKKNKTLTTKWSGGKTTELYIYPEKSDFKKLNFDFRLSTATIEVDKSDFTLLPNIQRTLLLLEGELKLNHKNHHSKEINLYENDKFNGSWETKSEGKAIDFNFMSPRDLNESINVLQLQKDSEFTDRNLNSFSFIFVHKGEIETNIGIASEGDLWINTSQELFDFKINKKSILVHLTLDLN